MLALIIISATIICVYSVLIIRFYIGWKSIPEHNYSENAPKNFISVIVSVRNEEKNLPGLLKQLSLQDYPQESYEVIIVNDHSTDNAKNVFDSSNCNENISFYNLPDKIAGKKKAVNYGVSKAKGELIVTTDADCRFYCQWLDTINSFYNKNKPDMIIGPVMIDPYNSLFAELQSLEFASLIASGAGASGLKSPIMCNAANLAFKKDLYNEFSDELNNKYQSGDDMFLMLAAKKNKKRIEFLKAKEAVVTTTAKKSLRAFVQQRLRWASKSGGYSDPFTIFTQLTVFILSSLCIYLVVFGNFNYWGSVILASVIGVKSIIDLVLLYPTLKFFGLKKLLRWFIQLQIVYFIYVFFIAIASRFVKFEWKERV